MSLQLGNKIYSYFQKILALDFRDECKVSFPEQTTTFAG